MNAHGVSDLIGEDAWSSYFKFSIVRNPWDRVISLWHQLINGPIGRRSGKSLKYFLEKYRPYPNEKGETYCDFLNHGEMDFIARYENRKEDLDYVSSQIGVEIDTQIHVRGNARSEQDYRTYYDDETIQVVAQKYREDIMRFGYTFDGS